MVLATCLEQAKATMKKRNFICNDTIHSKTEQQFRCLMKGTVKKTL